MRRFISTAIAALLLVALLPAGRGRADADPVRILFVGDSLTANLGHMDQLRSRLDATGFQYEMFNGGVGGIGTPGVVIAVGGMIRATQPDVVVIGIGTNDDLSAYQGGYYVWQPLIGGPAPAPQDFEQRFRTLLDAVRRASPTTKMLVALNQCPQTPPAPTWIQMPAKNNIIYRSAFDMPAGRYTPQVAGFVVLNHIPSSFMSPDGFHPSAAGQVKQQDQYYRALARLYGLPPIPDDPDLTAQCN